MKELIEFLREHFNQVQTTIESLTGVCQINSARLSQLKEQIKLQLDDESADVMIDCSALNALKSKLAKDKQEQEKLSRVRTAFMTVIDYVGSLTGMTPEPVAVVKDTVPDATATFANRNQFILANLWRWPLAEVPAFQKMMVLVYLVFGKEWFTSSQIREEVNKYNVLPKRMAIHSLLYACTHRLPRHQYLEDMAVDVAKATDRGVHMMKKQYRIAENQWQSVETLVNHCYLRLQQLCAEKQGS